LVGDVCAYCSLLSESGWICKIYDTTRRFKVEGQAQITLPEFLKATTDSVCDSINAMSPADIHALQPRYVKKDSVQDQTPPKISTKDEGKSSIPSKKGPGSVSARKQGKQKKNGPVEKNETLSINEIEIPAVNWKRMAKSRELVVAPDMRPVFGCIW
jgi:hypothetical protein